MILSLACLLGVQDLDVLLEQLGDDDPDLRAEASAAIRRMGSPAIPALERALAHPSSEVRGRAGDLLRRLPDYGLRRILKHPDYAEVRRRWTAVIEAAVWKRPLPAELAEEIGKGDRELRDSIGRVETRAHSAAEILSGLQEAAADILREQLSQVGAAGATKPFDSRLRLSAVQERDDLSLVLAAEPDATSFEEVYGTLLIVRDHGGFDALDTWTRDDWALAVRLLVQMRRRPGAPPLVPPAAREEILDLACRGPIVRGIADALGRAFTNRARGVPAEPERVKELREEQFVCDEVREIYGALMDLHRRIGRVYFQPELLRAAPPALPSVLAEVPAKHRALFDLVGDGSIGEADLRVTADVLSRLDGDGWQGRDAETTARLLRAVAALSAAAAR